MRKRIWRRLPGGAGILAGLYFVLLIPPSDPAPPGGGAGRPFAWNRDAQWRALEAQFAAARAQGCASLAGSIDTALERAHVLLGLLERPAIAPGDPLLDTLEEVIFRLGPMVGVCPSSLPSYLEVHRSLRAAVKDQSRGWDLSDAVVRDRLYRMLYGSRAAVEEVMLQAPPGSVPAVTGGTDEPSRTPSTVIRGIRIHSGDILVSRGGAPTSSLIARGNDYPGNFSHVALVYVDSSTGVASFIESHIEKGVAVATADQYLRDTKLRIMVLRLRADHPAMAADPMLPHRAAAHALSGATQRHIPYDFTMDIADTGAMFCSEVVSSAYRSVGVALWTGLSTISSPGVRDWLAAFGARHFRTQEPSDLEYDPQLRIVAEWRDPETLWKDHLDNSATDAMLEGAECGERLGYDWYLLPVSRVVKGYSAALNLFGLVGPIPEGMSAVAALRHAAFVRRHAAIVSVVRERAERIGAGRGYRSPYWELVSLARSAGRDIR